MTTLATTAGEAVAEEEVVVLVVLEEEDIRTAGPRLTRRRRDTPQLE